ncbi:MAG TPA: hypothetical protein VG435_17865 [Acidimicrobiales bacterium]|nr:hypothetical protein [Acidimicrobiales bacterium]
MKCVLLTLVAVLALGLVTVPLASPPAAAATGTGLTSPAYWEVAANGEVYGLGTTNWGDLRSDHLAQPVVGAAPTEDGLGYWLVARDGGVFAFGDARFHGSTGGVKLWQPIVAMAADPATGGYWFVAADGGVFAFDAPFFGSLGGIRLDRPIVGMAATPDGQGYYLVASDGGVFAFGDAHFHGSTGGVRLARPIVGMAVNAQNTGYWMAASDGGIFAFGTASFYGSTGGDHLNAPVIGMTPMPNGSGYWLAASDGGVFPFGHAPYLGTSGTNGTPPIVAIMSTANGYLLPPGGTGYDVSQFQCSYYSSGATLPAGAHRIAVVQVSGGALDQAQPSGCYQMEANWAGPGFSAYIFMDPCPTSCNPYQYGMQQAEYWVRYARNAGTNPTLWWLDVETCLRYANGICQASWDMSQSGQAANSQEMAGAVAGLKASGVSPGIYSTHLQWTDITGGRVSFPDIPLWVPGAGNISGGSGSAVSFCTNPDANHAPFAGGRTILVQYGYNDPNRRYDEDYACP